MRLRATPDHGDQIDVSKIGETSNGEPSYSGAGADHNQETKSSDGAIFVLEDGSVWAVEDADRAKAEAWTDSSTIHVSEDESGGSGSYVLTNEDESPPESVTATHIGDK